MGLRLVASFVIAIATGFTCSSMAQSVPRAASSTYITAIDPHASASPLTIGGTCTVYSNNNTVTGALPFGSASILAAWSTQCTGVVTASMISVYGRYQIQILQGGVWGYIYDGNAQGYSAYLPNLPPGSYRIVGYNPQSSGSANFSFQYSRPIM